MKIYILHMKALAAVVLLLCTAAIVWRIVPAAPAFSAWKNAQTLVIDAGHGGFDGGAIGANGTTEQHINLSIARRTQALAGFFGIQTEMTRQDENALDFVAGNSVRQNKTADIKKREQIANAAQNPIFISIHLNKFVDPQYSGAQVFYSKNAPDSKLLAQNLQSCLMTGIHADNHRQAKLAADTIYLMKKLSCPAVIVECGFLSNPAEEQLLQEESYHKKLTVCIMSGYLCYQAASII